MPVRRHTGAVAWAAPSLSCVVRATRERSRQIRSDHDRMAGASVHVVTTRGACQERHVTCQALAGEDELSLPARELMCCIRMPDLDLQIVIGIVRDRAFSVTAHTSAVAAPAFVAGAAIDAWERIRRKPENKTPKNKEGHPVMLDGPSSQVMFSHYAGRRPPQGPVPPRVPMLAGK